MNAPEFFIYGDIGQTEDGTGITAANVISALNALPSGAKPIVRIHSAGGSVGEGTAIFNAIKNHPGGAVTQIDSIAGSMASVIAMAGSPVRMAGNALLMIHNVQNDVQGDAEALRRGADVADKTNETIVAAYSEKTGLSRKKIRELMDANAVMTAREALALGFVDEITGPVALAARVPAADALGASFDKSKTGMSNEAISAEDKSLLQRLRAFFKPESGEDPIAKVNADLLTARTSLAEITTARDKALDETKALITERDSLTAKITALDGTVAKLNADLLTAQTELKTERDGLTAKIDKEVTARIASAGGDPIKRDPKAATNPGGTMARAEFTTKNAAEQMAYIKAGGKITD